MAIEFLTSITRFMRGRRVDAQEWNGFSRILEGATPVYFGNPVQRGSGERGCAPLTSGVFIGVAEANVVLSSHVGDTFAQYDTVPVMESGVIGVMAGESVQAGDAAAFDATYGTNTGGWVVADTANPQIPGCEFVTGGAAGTIVALRVRRPVPAA